MADPNVKLPHIYSPATIIPDEKNPAELMPPIEESPPLSPDSRLRKTIHAANYAVKSAVVTAEILPITNEGSRYGALAATELITRNPLVGAAVLGGSTLLVEGAGAIAASDLITGETSNKLIKWVNEKLEKIVPTNVKMSKPVEASVALYAGAPSLMLLKQRQNPHRTKEEARKQGLITTAWMSGVCAVEGAAISEGLGNYADPKKLAAALVVVGVFTAIPAWVKKRLKKEEALGNSILKIEPQSDSLQAEDSKGDTAEVRYKLTPEELDELERELVDMIKEKYPQEGIVNVWIRPNNKFANFVRSHESKLFPEVEEVSEEDERNTLFMALVDTRSPNNKIVHAATVTGINHKNDKDLVIGGHDLGAEETGFFTIDSLIERGNFTAKEFHDYYAHRGINLKKCISIETNFRIGEKTEKFHGLRTPDLAYLMFSKILEKKDSGPGESVVFATINKASVVSFQRIGLACEPLMGRTDMTTPELTEGRESLPVAIPYDAKTRKFFNSMDVQVPELFV